MSHRHWQRRSQRRRKHNTKTKHSIVSETNHVLGVLELNKLVFGYIYIYIYKMNTTIFNNQQLIPYDIINLCILFFHEHENKQNYYKKSWYAVENNYIQNTFILHQCKFQFNQCHYNHSINEYSNWSFTLLSLPQTNNSKLQIGFIVLYYEIYYDNNKLLDIDIARFHQKNDKKEAALPVCLNTHITHNNFINPNFTKINLFAKLIRIEYKKYTNFRYCELNPIILMPINIKYEWILQNAYHNQNVFSSKFGNKFYWILIGTLHIDGFYVYLRLLSLPINVSCIKVKLKYVTNIIKNRKMFETKIVQLRYCKTEGG
eukprot:399907_1